MDAEILAREAFREGGGTVEGSRVGGGRGEGDELKGLT